MRAFHSLSLAACTAALLVLAGAIAAGARARAREAATLKVDSPFDYARHAVLYHPEGLPEPAAPGYTAALIEAIVPVLEASRGRAFLLFTSYRALNEAHERLDGRVPYPLLKQGSLPKAKVVNATPTATMMRPANCTRLIRSLKARTPRATLSSGQMK